VEEPKASKRVVVLKTPTQVRRFADGLPATLQAA
jgi:hypothetical protein